MRISSVHTEYDMDETYVEGYTREEGMRAYFSANIRTNSKKLYTCTIFLLYVHIDNWQDPLSVSLSVSGSHPTTPVTYIY